LSITSSLQTEAGSKVIPAKQPIPFKKKIKNKKGDGTKTPSFQKGKKKRKINPNQPPCTPGLVEGVRVPESVVLVGKAQ